MAITISTHNGSSVSLAHNIREPKLITAENKRWAERHPGEIRINPNGTFEIWQHQSLAEAYRAFFDEAVQEWNERQIARGRKDRVIQSYLSEISGKENTSKNAKHPAYEMIYAIGSKENPVPESVSRAILRKIADDFPKRNSHLRVISITYHNDEFGVPHIHCVYVPVVTDCKRGMRIQNNLSAALRQQGIFSTSKGRTAQMIWEERENQCLEQLCREYGYEVVHPQRGGAVTHLSVEEYRLQQQIEEKQRALQTVTQLPAGKTIVNKGRLAQLEAIEKIYNRDKAKLEQAGRDIRTANEAFRAYGTAEQKLQSDKQKFNEAVNAAANAKLTSQKSNAMQFLAEFGLTDIYLNWAKQVERINREMTERRDGRER